MSDASLISIRDISRVYRMGDTEVVALDGVDLDITSGEFVAIVGPSGSGKSTLMYILGLLDQPSGGSYQLSGMEVSRLNDSTLSAVRNRTIGYVFQQFFLLNEVSVTENIALGLVYAGRHPKDRDARAMELARDVGLEHRTDHKPTELSGGQIQRVAVARALAGRPHLILADEPTGNLDQHTGKEIMALLRDLHQQGHTIVLVTHDPKVARTADRVVTILDGKITSDERLADPPTEGEDLEPIRKSSVGKRLRLADLFRVALREGVLAHKLRSLLTMTGIILGIAAVITMGSITEGGKRQQLEQIRRIGLNSIQIHAQELEGSRLLEARRLNPDGLTRHDAEAVKDQVEGIEDVAIVKRLKAELRYADSTAAKLSVQGVDGDLLNVGNIELESGRFIRPSDSANFRRVCVLGAHVAKDLGLTPETALGAVVLVGEVPCTVVGLTREMDMPEGLDLGVSVDNRNRSVYLPLPTLQAFFLQDPRRSELDSILLKMASDKDLVARSQHAALLINNLHRGTDDTTITVPLEKLKQAQATRQVFNLIIIVISGISLLVGGIGIMNNMLASVTERTREIGIRRAIGASRSHIMRQFLTESLVIATTGGLLGIALGFAGAAVVTLASGYPAVVNPWLVVISAGVSMGVGIVFGIYPAWLAANKDPVEALRG